MLQDAKLISLRDQLNAEADALAKENAAKEIAAKKKKAGKANVKQTQDTTIGKVANKKTI
jgi:hypothetical protein